jgi:hypothetical protein
MPTKAPAPPRTDRKRGDNHGGCDRGYPARRAPDPDASRALRAEALFASGLQSSESPSPEQVQRAVATTLRRLGVRGCAERLAGEFGDHPEVAAARMTWALATVRAVYPESIVGPGPAGGR